MRGIAAGNEATVKLSFAPRQDSAAGATPAPGAPGTPGTAPPGTTPQVQPPAAEPKPPAAEPPPAAATPGAGPTVTFAPSAAQAQLGGPLAVAVQVNNATDLFAAPMRIKYDPKVLRLNEIRPGALFSGDGQQPTFTRDIRNEVGEASWNLNRLPGSSGVSGSGTVAVLTFQVIGKGSTTVTVPEINLRNSQMQPLTTTAPSLTVTVP
jgi:hypothetical protein